MINYTDQTLIQMLKSSGEKTVDKAVRYLCITYKSSIYSLLMSRSLDLDSAEHIFNDSILALIKNAKKGLLDHPDAQIKPYLIVICKNKAATWFNKNKGHQDRTININDPSIQKELIEEDFLEQMMSKEKKEAIRTLIKKLGEKCQTILIGFYIHGLSMEALATKLNYANEQVARNKKAKCMKKLKDFLNGLEGQ